MSDNNDAYINENQRMHSESTEPAAGDIGNNVGQDNGQTAPEGSNQNWEEQAKYFQSEKDKMAAENQKLKNYEKIGKFLESRPDVVNGIKSMVQGGQPQRPMPQRPQGPPPIEMKADEFDPWEAYNNPQSKSYQYRAQKDSQMVNSAVNKAVGGFANKMQQQQNMGALQQQLAQKGLSPEESQQFMQWASRNPADYGVDNVLKMWRATTENPQVQQQPNPLDQVRQNLQRPAQGGVVQGQQPQRKSSGDEFWEQVMGANRVGGDLP